MASKMVTNILQGNAKFAASYTTPAPLMKMREIWQKSGSKGTVISESPHWTQERD